MRDDIDEAGSTTSKNSGGGHKFVPTEVDPTEGEWATHKTMEIWLNRTEALTEPKWARGNLRENIDPSSLFHNIIHIINVEQHEQHVSLLKCVANVRSCRLMRCWRLGGNDR
jgi:hypothetical protein